MPHYERGFTDFPFDSIHCNSSVLCAFSLKDVRPSDKFGNPYLIIPWVTNDNSEHLCEPVSGTCFRVLCTLLYLHEHCPYITYYFFCCQSFIYNFTKMLAVSINLQHDTSFVCISIVLNRLFFVYLYMTQEGIEKLLNITDRSYNSLN